MTTKTWNRMAWDVYTIGETWELMLGYGLDFHTIGSADMPYGIAVDAALEFMDRLPESNLTPQHLMRLCVRNAWRQR